MLLCSPMYMYIHIYYPPLLSSSRHATMPQQRHVHVIQRTYGSTPSGWAHIIINHHIISSGYDKPLIKPILPNPSSPPHHPHHQTLYILDSSFNPAHTRTLPHYQLPPLNPPPPSTLSLSNHFSVQKCLLLLLPTQNAERDWSCDNRDSRCGRDKETKPLPLLNLTNIPRMFISSAFDTLVRLPQSQILSPSLLSPPLFFSCHSSPSGRNASRGAICAG